MNTRILITTAGYVAAFFYINTALATDFCATSVTEIQQALAEASSNGESDHIKIKKGSYDAPIGGFQYGVGDHNSEYFNIEISGGWFGDSSEPCAQQTRTTPTNTVLDGGFMNRILRLDPSNLTDITITDIHFNEGHIDQNQGGGALYITTSLLPVIYTGRVLIERNVFYNNYGDYGAVHLNTSSGTVHVRNNFFRNNQTKQVSTAAFTYWPTVAGSQGRLYFTNNTVVSSSTISSNPNTSSGVAIVSLPGSVVFLGNNILWDNQINDLRINGTGIRALTNNDVNSQYISQPLDNDLDNISVDPLFNNPFSYDYTLHMYSPLINQGYNSPGSAEWYMGDYDVLGKRRIYNSTIDMGAFEFNPDIIFVNGFE